MFTLPSNYWIVFCAPSLSLSFVKCTLILNFSIICCRNSNSAFSYSESAASVRAIWRSSSTHLPLFFVCAPFYGKLHVQAQRHAHQVEAVDRATPQMLTRLTWRGQFFHIWHDLVSLYIGMASSTPENRFALGYP